MANDFFKLRGATKSSKPDAGGGVVRSEPAIAIVKNNIDPTRSGRIQVYLQDIGGSDPDDSTNWITVGYMSPFYGVTPANGPENGYGDYTKNPASYGVWNSAPDIGTEVVCIFINGDMNYGFYIGCVPNADSLTMVPAIGSGQGKVILNGTEAQSYGGAERLPVTNMNINDTSKANDASFIIEPKPVHSYSASIYFQQGLLRDPIRGPISSSAQRETPSRVGWGVSTPGRPIYEGGYDDSSIADSLEASNGSKLTVTGRRPGHSFVMDDGDLIGRDQLIRLRSTLGHQILLSDDGQCLNIIHANGQSWIELGKEGTIDMYSTNSVNIRTQGDLNLHADNNVNINAAKNLNIAAGESINMTAEKDVKFKAGANFNQYSMGKYTVKVDGAMSMSSAGQASYASGAETFINGSKVNLNTGSAGLVPEKVAPIPVVAHTDTLFDDVKGFAAAPGYLLSIVSRAPAHAPWASAGQGVDVKTTLSSSAALPSAPSAAVASANSSAPATPDNPVTVSSAATVPDAGAISKSLDKNATASMVGAMAKTAATGAAASVVNQGTGIIKNAAGQAQAVVGTMALTPQQIEAAGGIKPGAAKLIDGLVAQGKTVTEAMTSNLFTGKPGAENVTALAKNIQAQVQTTVTNLQQSQTALTQAGILTGKESPASIAGLVTAGVTAGIKATTDFVKNSANSISKLLPGSGAGGISDVAKSISSGNFAANLSQNVTGGLGSIAGALGGLGKSASEGLSGLLDNAKGVAGSAFSAVTKAFKPLEAGVPQDLTAIAKKNAEEAATADAGTTSTDKGLLDKVTDAAGNAVTSAKNALTGSVTGALDKVTASAKNAFASVTSGLGGIPGGSKTIASVVNNSPGATNSIPGLGAVTSLVQNASTAVTNGISSTQAALSSATSIASKLPGPLAGVATGALAQANGLLSTANNLAKTGTDLLNKGSSLVAGLEDKTKSLSSLATSGLPPGAAAQLNASINSLSAGGPIPIKLPTVAVGTNDRSGVTSQVTGLIGSAKIPSPKFDTEGSAQAKSKVEDLLAKQNDLIKEKAEQDKIVDDAAIAWATAKTELPQGDPKIDTLLSAFNDEMAKAAAIEEKIKNLSA